MAMTGDPAPEGLIWTGNSTTFDVSVFDSASKEWFGSSVIYAIGTGGVDLSAYVKDKLTPEQWGHVEAAIVDLFAAEYIKRRAA